MLIHDVGANNLREGIIKQAISDYKNALIGNWKMDIAECERFFFVRLVLSANRWC